MQKLRVSIVDDEPIARKGIRKLLDRHPDVEIIAECGDGRSAVEVIRKASPDIVFLDVQMPEMDGFDVVAAVGLARLPVVIFVTAYDQHALRAFDAHAIDYLLKPVDPNRFQSAINKARQQVRGCAVDALGRGLLGLLGDVRQPPATPQRIAVKTGGKIFFLKPEDVDWAEAADNYVKLHSGGKTHLLHETLASISERLPAHLFLRIHRSKLVNVDRIREIHTMFQGNFEVVLRDGTHLSTGRNYRESIHALIGQPKRSSAQSRA